MTDIELVVEAKREVGKLVRDRLASVGLGKHKSANDKRDGKRASMSDANDASLVCVG